MQSDLLSSLLSHRLWAQVPFEVQLALSFGNPLQCSCLENPRDGGAWWAAVHGVAQSQTQLKRLSMHACLGEGNGNPLQNSCLGESCGQRSLVGCCPWGRTESDTTERLSSSSSRPEVPFPLGQLGQSDSGLGRPTPRPSTQPENIKGFPRCQHVDQLQGLTKSRT